MNNKTFIITTMLIAVIVLGIGYASITATLTVNGAATGTQNAANFKIGFTGAPSGELFDENNAPMTEEGKTATATLGTASAVTGTVLNANFSVTGFDTLGEYAVFTYTITNDSEDIDATLALPAIATNSNPTYFGISAELFAAGSDTKTETPLVLAPGDTATLKITVGLDKNITGENETGNFQVNVVATGDATTEGGE